MLKLQWADSIRSLTMIEADVYFDLLFEFDAERIFKLKRLLPRLVFVNSVVNTCNEIGEGYWQNKRMAYNDWEEVLQRLRLQSRERRKDCGCFDEDELVVYAFTRYNGHDHPAN